MAFEREDALSGADIPNLCSIVKGSRHKLISICVEAEGYDFSGVTRKGEDFLSGFNVPQLGGAVHGACGD